MQAAAWQERADRIRQTPRRRTPAGFGQPPDDDQDWIDAREAAGLLHVTTSALHTRCRQDHLPSVIHGGQRWLRRINVQIALNVAAFRAHMRST